MSSKLSIEELPIYLKTNIMILLNHRDFSSFLCVNREFWSIGNNNVNEEFGNITESLYFHRINKLFNKLSTNQLSFFPFLLFLQKRTRNHTFLLWWKVPCKVVFR